MDLAQAYADATMTAVLTYLRWFADEGQDPGYKLRDAADQIEKGLVT